MNPKAEKVQFRDKHVMLVGWIKALAFRECDALKEYCAKINQSNLKISWFKDKVLRFEFESEEEFKKRKSFLSAG